MKNIVCCGSFNYKKRMEEFKRELENHGYEVILPRFALGELTTGEIRKIKEKVKRGEKILSLEEIEKIGETIDWFFDQIKKADLVVVFDIDGHIGINTAMDVAIAAMYKRKTIFIQEPENRGVYALIKKLSYFEIIPLNEITKAAKERKL